MPLILMLVLVVLGTMVGIQATEYEGTIALFPSPISLVKGEETAVFPDWPYIDIQVKVTKVIDIVGIMFSLEWNSSLFDYVSISEGDFLGTVATLTPLMVTAVEPGKLHEVTWGQLAPFDPQTYIDPDRGWVVTIRFEVIAEPAIDLPIDTYINVTNYNTENHMIANWSKEGVMTLFDNMLPCHFHYEAVETLVHDVEGFNVVTVSKSIVSNVTLVDEELMELRLNVTGQEGMTSFCNVTIPKALLKAEPLEDWVVTVDGEAPLSIVITTNATHTFAYLTYTHTSTQQVIVKGTWVIPEFPTLTFLPLLMIATIAATILGKKLRLIKRRDRIFTS